MTKNIWSDIRRYLEADVKIQVGYLLVFLFMFGIYLGIQVGSRIWP